MLTRVRNGYNAVVENSRRKGDLISEVSDGGHRCVPVSVCRFAVILMSLFVIFDSRGLSESSADLLALFHQVSLLDNPDGSRYFAAASGPIFPHQVSCVRGNFMPQNPFIFYVTWGSLDTPWLFLPAFQLFVTCGRLLHHEHDFSYFQARTRVLVGTQRVSIPITLIIPHVVKCPGPFWPSFQDMVEMPYRTKLEELILPEVEIYTHRDRVWDWTKVEQGPWTEAQAASCDKLRESWERCTEILTK